MAILRLGSIFIAGDLQTHYRGRKQLMQGPPITMR